MKLSMKLNLLLGLQLLGAVAALGVFSSHLRSTRMDWHVINIAGAQRMYATQLAEYAYMVSIGQEEDRTGLASLTTTFDDNLRALRTGGLAMGREIPKPSPEVFGELSRLQTIWSPLKSQLDDLYQTPVNAPGFTSLYARIFSANKRLQNASSTLASALDARAERLRQRIQFVLLGVVTFAFVILIAGIVLVKRYIVSPITRLSNAARAVGSGDFNKRLSVTTNDELSELASLFNDMSIKLDKHTGELDQVNRQLEREISERQSMESELRLAQKLEAIGQLSAGIAHEINTPMQFIGDNAHFVEQAFTRLMTVLDAYEKIAEAQSEDDVTEALALARSSAEHARLSFLRERVPKALASTLEGVAQVSRIVQAMKNFSHAGSDEMVPTDVNEAVRATILVSRNEWRYVADLQTDLAANLPLLPCLAGELNQVLLNIIVNASHAILDHKIDDTSPKGRIDIVTRLDHEVLEITISDTGGGIPLVALDRVFDPFFTTKEVGRGTGQGLTLSRSIVVDKHGGTLDFQSELGVGTTFRIRLPLKQAEREHEQLT